MAGLPLIFCSMKLGTFPCVASSTRLRTHSSSCERVLSTVRPLGCRNTGTGQICLIRGSAHQLRTVAESSQPR